MSAYGKEGRKIIQALIEKLNKEGTLDPNQSKNHLKHMRRALGSALFSPDALGYLDIIENGLTEGLPASKILSKIRGSSDKLVESYSFAKGIFEAHHVMPLNALRDNFIQLSPDEQDKFLQMLDDSGWQLGDSPQQLMNTLQSRMSHQAKVPDLSKGGDVAGKTLFQGAKIPEAEIVSHGAPDGVVRTNWNAMTAKGATTADELMGQFGNLASVYQRQALLGNISEATMRQAVQAQTGINLGEMTPELADKIKKSEGLQSKILTTAAQNYNPPGKYQGAELFEQLTGQFFDKFKPDPDLTRRVTRMLQNPGVQQMAQKLGYLNDIPKPLLGAGAGGALLQATGFVGDAIAGQEGVQKVQKASTPRERVKGTLQTLGAGLGIASTRAPNPLTIGGSAIASGLAGVMDWVDQQQVQRTRRTNLETGLGNSTAYTVGSNEPDEEYRPPELVPTVQPRSTPNRYERRNR